MRFRLFFLFAFWLSSLTLLAQDGFTLKGQVIDAESGEPLPFATVFFAETTYGVVANGEGQYSLTVDKPGTYDLIVRFVGYRTFAQQVKLGDSPEVTLNVTVQQEAQNLGSVVVTANKDRDWQRHMNQFRETFLGLSLNARQCRILNEEIIDFYYDEEKRVLEAFATEPVIVENKALGYKLQYYLEQFVIDYKSNISSYYGYTVFEEMKGNARKQRRWEKNRKIAYEGSATHFFTSLYENKLLEEGFEVQVAQDVSGFGRVLNPRDANVYEYLKGGTTDLSKTLPFENILYITFKKEMESKTYLEAERQGKVTLGHSSVGRVRMPQRSWISLMEGFESIEFEPSGYVYNPVSFYSAGYWGFEKVADMVPINYRPKEEIKK